MKFAAYLCIDSGIAFFMYETAKRPHFKILKNFCNFKKII